MFVYSESEEPFPESVLYEDFTVDG